MKTNFCILIFSLITTSFLWGQNAYFYIEVDSDTVNSEQVFQVRYTVENAEAYGFTPPHFYDFEQIPGEGTATSYQNINGQEKKTMSYTYTLKPKYEGTLMLPAAQIETNMGTLYASERAIIASAHYVAPYKQNDLFSDGFGQGMPNMDDFNSLFDMQGMDLGDFDINNFNLEGFEMPSFEDMNKMMEEMMQGFNFEMPEIPQKKEEEKTYKL